MATSRTGAAARKTATGGRGRQKARPRAVPRGAPTTADLRRIARSIVTSTCVWDEKRMLSLYAPEVEAQEPGREPTFGIAAIEQKLARWNRRVAEQRWYARNLWVDGQTVIVEWEASLTLRSSGRRKLLREVAIHEIRNGKIVRERYYYDPRQAP